MNGSKQFEWRINVDVGKRIYVQFVTFDLEYSVDCATEYVTIHDAVWYSLGRHCWNRVSVWGFP